MSFRIPRKQKKRVKKMFSDDGHFLSYNLPFKSDEIDLLSKYMDGKYPSLGDIKTPLEIFNKNKACAYIIISPQIKREE